MGLYRHQRGLRFVEKTPANAFVFKHYLQICRRSNRMQCYVVMEFTHMLKEVVDHNKHTLEALYDIFSHDQTDFISIITQGDISKNTIHIINKNDSLFGPFFQEPCSNI